VTDVHVRHSWQLDAESVRALAVAVHPNPFAVLGPQDSANGRVVRAFLPGAIKVDVLRRSDGSLVAPLAHTDASGLAPKDLVHIVMSTLSVAFELEQAHAETGIAYIAAPVMGRPDVAAAGKLNILAAGDPTVSTE
jgi:3-hydroxyisobutyrate dehydrogenase-like beta-hydroxyacid dehydrogenase